MNTLKNKGDFAQKLAHDISTPLSVLNQFMSFVSQELKDEDTLLFYKAARLSLGKILKLVESLKKSDFTQKIKKEKVDIAGLIKGVLSELEILAAQNGIRLKYLGPDMLDCLADPLAIERITQNLVKNALQAGRHGGYVEVRLFQRDEDIQIDVRDDGCGIAAENIDHVFENGFTEGRHSGTGLGLSYCKETVEAHGGSINVYSEYGIGTQFSITLPNAAPKTFEDEDSYPQAYMLGEHEISLGVF